LFKNILTEKEARVIKMRFGIGGAEPMTLEQVGEVFGVTRERVRQIESKALRKLRASPQMQELKVYL
jgi:RNA polymerase primary sigma factor